MSDLSDLRLGASPENDPNEAEYGPSREVVARIVDDLMRPDSAPSSTPLPTSERSGVPRGYGKYGDLA